MLADTFQEYIGNFNELEKLPDSIAEQPIATVNFRSLYILAETLQGFKDDREFKAAKKHLLLLPILRLAQPELYISAAQLYRTCRKQGLTIRKTADCLIAQTAIEHDAHLLHKR